MQGKFDPLRGVFFCVRPGTLDPIERIALTWRRFIGRSKQISVAPGAKVRRRVPFRISRVLPGYRSQPLQNRLDRWSHRIHPGCGDGERAVREALTWGGPFAEEGFAEIDQNGKYQRSFRSPKMNSRTLGLESKRKCGCGSVHASSLALPIVAPQMRPTESNDQSKFRQGMWSVIVLGASYPVDERWVMEARAK